MLEPEPSSLIPEMLVRWEGYKGQAFLKKYVFNRHLKDQEIAVQVASGSSFHRGVVSNAKLWVKCFPDMCTELWNIRVVSDRFAAPGFVGSQ